MARTLAAVAFEFVGPGSPKFTISEKILSGDMYEKLVKRSFKAWRKKMLPRAGSTRLPLVKDYERFLRQDRNLKAEEAAGLKTLREHPKVAPGRNAM